MTWKTFAIILLVITILETIFLVTSLYVGLNIIEEENNQILRENMCIEIICEGYNSYWIDPITGLCSCYQNGEVVYETYIQ